MFLALQQRGAEKWPRYLLSAATRLATLRGERLGLTTDTIDGFIASVPVPRDPSEAIDRILKYVHGKTRRADALIPLYGRYAYPVAVAQDEAEFGFLIGKAAELGLLESLSGGVRLTIEGWRRVDQLASRHLASNQAFVAMWLDESMKAAWDEGIRPALRHLGYSPVRVDEVPHNQKICDRIVVEIRRSVLLVAEVTGHRPGVYFEAGYAMGLGIPVVWCCRKDDLDNAHFDTRQYNHVVWEDPADLRAKLSDRVEATIDKRLPAMD